MVKFIRNLFGNTTNEIDNTAFGATDTGLRRDHNEDCFLIKASENVYIVADGMGGHNAGEVASAAAADIAGSYFTPELIEDLRQDRKNIEEEMTKAAISAHQGVLQLAGTNSEYVGMGTTIVLAFIHKQILHTCHVGDSRVYVIDQEYIEQITEDHSTAAELIKEGRMTREEARYSMLSGQLSQAIGVYLINPEYHERKLKKGDLVLLCSDGLWDMLDDSKISTIVTGGGTMKEICLRLIKAANSEGGYDNITVLLVNPENIKS